MRKEHVSETTILSHHMQICSISIFHSEGESWRSRRKSYTRLLNLLSLQYLHAILTINREILEDVFVKLKKQMRKRKIWEEQNTFKLLILSKFLHAYQKSIQWYIAKNIHSNCRIQYLSLYWKLRKLLCLSSCS